MKALRSGVVAAVLILAGCGFHPLYGTAHAPQAALGSIYVGIIPNHSGQLLRQALQSRLEGIGGSSEKQYVLNVAYFEAPQGIGVQRDNSTTRNRDVGSASWSLHPADDTIRQIASGSVRTLDGYNIIDEQFFYADLSEEAAQRRIADALADQIVTGLAAYFGNKSGKG